MRLFGACVFLVLAAMSLRRKRWAYVAFVLLGLFYFPAKVGFHLSPRACDFALDVPLAIFSLTNYAHIILLSLFFVMTSAQLRRVGWSTMVWTGAITLAMGGLVELAEGVTGSGHCRLRDLVPDAAGAVLGAAIVAVWWQVRTRKAGSSS
jgi:VanZ family protein